MLCLGVLDFDRSNSTGFALLFSVKACLVVHGNLNNRFKIRFKG